jgi:hypothetical protein
VWVRCVARLDRFYSGSGFGKIREGRARGKIYSTVWVTCL